ASDLSPVLTTSLNRTSSLNLSGTASGRATRRAVTLPSSVVTTPAFGGACANAADGARKATLNSTARQRFIMDAGLLSAGARNRAKSTATSRLGDHRRRGPLLSILLVGGPPG